MVNVLFTEHRKISRVYSDSGRKKGLWIKRVVGKGVDVIVDTCIQTLHSYLPVFHYDYDYNYYLLQLRSRSWKYAVGNSFCFPSEAV